MGNEFSKPPKSEDPYAFVRRIMREEEQGKRRKNSPKSSPATRPELRQKANPLQRAGVAATPPSEEQNPLKSVPMEESHLGAQRKGLQPTKLGLTKITNAPKTMAIPPGEEGKSWSNIVLRYRSALNAAAPFPSLREISDAVAMMQEQDIKFTTIAAKFGERVKPAGAQQWVGTMSAIRTFDEKIITLLEENSSDFRWIISQIAGICEQPENRRLEYLNARITERKKLLGTQA